MTSQAHPVDKNIQMLHITFFIIYTDILKSSSVFVNIIRCTNHPSLEKKQEKD